MTQLDQIPVPADGLRRMLVLLRAVIHEAGLQDREDLVEFSECCKAVVEDALRIKTN